MKTTLLAAAGWLCLACPRPATAQTAVGSRAVQTSVAAAIPDPNPPPTPPAPYPCPALGIRTNPPAAYNPEPQGYQNSFNWYFGLTHPDPQLNGRRYQVNSQYSSIAELFLPWEQPGNTNMDRIAGKRDLPKDGWELVRRDLGFTDAGSPRTVDNPHVILYNRYTGMLRIFVAQGRLLNQNQLAEIKLVFSGDAAKKAGTLNRQSALGVALENTEQGLNTEMISVARFLNTEMKWFMADFPMDYDPCACLFDSKLKIEVNLISEANIQMTGVTTGSLATATGGNGATGAEFDKGPSFLKKAAVSANASIAAGGKVCDNLNKFASSLKAKEDAQAAASNNPAAGSAPAANRKLLIDQFKNALGSSGFLKQGLAALPYVGAAVGALDFFFGGGKEESGPQPVAMQPMTIEMTTQFTGTITASNLYMTLPFNNPGTRQLAATPERYPYYNETMGVFSLIRQPVVQQSSTYFVNDDGQQRRRVSFRVPQDLQYAINEAAHLTIQDFQVALVLEQNNADAQPSNDFFSFEALKNGYPVYRTDYLDSGNLRDYVFSLETYGGSSINSLPGDLELKTGAKIYLKFLVNLRDINAAPTTQNVLLVTKYSTTLNTVPDVGAPGPANRPFVLPQMTPTTLGSFCNSQTYADRVNLRPVKNGARTGGAALVVQAMDDISLFPNPATQSTIIKLHLMQAGVAHILIHDTMGRMVYASPAGRQYAVGTTEIIVPTDHLANGVYYCKVTVNGQRQTRKLVVLH